MRLGLTATGAALATLLVLLSAQAAPRGGQRVAVTGCITPGGTPTCLLIKGADGTVYNVTAINPRPRAFDRVIRVRGTVSDKTSTCDQAIVLERIRWSRAGQLCQN
jgi:hypothetical protein